jgi:hypothetical protein
MRLRENYLGLGKIGAGPADQGPSIAGAPIPGKIPWRQGENISCPPRGNCQWGGANAGQTGGNRC